MFSLATIGTVQLHSTKACNVLDCLNGCEHAMARAMSGNGTHPKQFRTLPYVFMASLIDIESL